MLARMLMLPNHFCLFWKVEKLCYVTNMGFVEGVNYLLFRTECMKRALHLTYFSVQSK